MVLKNVFLSWAALVVIKSTYVFQKSVSRASLSGKDIQNEKNKESYPKSKKHVKIVYDTQKEETECQCSRTQPQISASEFDFSKELTEDGTSDSDDPAKECLRIFSEFTEKREDCKGGNAEQVGTPCF